MLTVVALVLFTINAAAQELKPAAQKDAEKKACYAKKRVPYKKDDCRRFRKMKNKMQSRRKRMQNGDTIKKVRLKKNDYQR